MKIVKTFALALSFALSTLAVAPTASACDKPDCACKGEGKACDHKDCKNKDCPHKGKVEKKDETKQGKK